MRELFQPGDPGSISDLLQSHPLAWVVSQTREGLRASTIPILAHCDANGRVECLEGHFPRRNPQVEGLRDDPHALFLFIGPHSYISPGMVRDKTWGPTWNFAHSQFQARIEFFDTANLIEAHLRRLIDAMEKDRTSPWSLDDMGPRYRGLMDHIIGFNAHIDNAQHRYKLGQDERPEIFADICDALGDTPLRRLMRQQRQD